MIHIYDGNNYFRRKLETGSTPRSIFNEFLGLNNDQHIVVWDGPHALKARRAVFPDYKAQRKPASSDIYVNFDTIRDILCHTLALQVRVPGFEADDVIAELVKGREGECHIHSNDRDFLALGVACDAKPLDFVPVQWTRLYKTFVGDTSDNIPGCPGFGARAWAECDPEALHSWLLDGTDYDFPARAKPDREQLLKFWEIIGFLKVEIGPEHIMVGAPDWQKGHDYLSEILN